MKPIGNPILQRFACSTDQTTSSAIAQIVNHIFLRVSKGNLEAAPLPVAGFPLLIAVTTILFEQLEGLDITNLRRKLQGRVARWGL